MLLIFLALARVSPLVPTRYLFLLSYSPLKVKALSGRGLAGVCLPIAPSAMYEGAGEETSGALS